jgi:cytochrome P450
VTAEQLEAMKYLRAVQKESQRILPAIGGLNRITQKETVLSGYRLPAGTGVAVINNIIMTSADNFPDPEVFRPERWLKGHANYERADPFTHLAFGHGPRLDKAA